jgi:hypothetical protein
MVQSNLGYGIVVGVVQLLLNKRGLHHEPRTRGATAAPHTLRYSRQRRQVAVGIDRICIEVWRRSKGKAAGNARAGLPLHAAYRCVIY